MLVLSRRIEEKLQIGDTVITILGVQRGRVKIGIQAPPDVPVVRGELIRQMKDLSENETELLEEIRECDGAEIPKEGWPEAEELGVAMNDDVEATVARVRADVAAAERWRDPEESEEGDVSGEQASDWIANHDTDYATLCANMAKALGALIDDLGDAEYEGPDNVMDEHYRNGRDALAEFVSVVGGVQNV